MSLKKTLTHKLYFILMTPIMRFKRMHDLKKILMNCTFCLMSTLTLSWTTPKNISNPGVNYDPSVSVNSVYSAVTWINGTFPGSSIQCSNYDGSGSTPFLYDSDSWSAPTTISGSGTNVAPTVKVDASGNIIAVWDSITEQGTATMSAKKINGFGWDSPVTLSTSALNYFSSVALNDNGQSIAGWIDHINNEVQICTLTVGGSWSSPTTVSNTSSNKGNLQIGIDALGNAILIWEDFDTNMIVVSQNTEGFESSFSAPANITSSGVNTTPNLNVNPEGNAIVAWTDVQTYDVLASIYESGSWTSSIVISETYSSSPSVEALEDQYFVSFYNLDSGNNQTVVNVSGTWSNPVDLSTNNSSQNPTTSTYLDTLFTVWTDGMTALVNVVEYPIDGTPSSPIEIATEGNCFLPQVDSSVVMTVVAWENNFGSDLFIQVNAN